MSDQEHTSESQPERLQLMFGISAAAVRQAARALRVATGSRGLDAGCGIGRHVGLFAREVGPSGRVTGLDISPENLAWARALYDPEAVEPGTEARGSDGSDAGGWGADVREDVAEIDFVQGDIRRLPFADESFDWVWCADTLWSGAGIGDPVAVVDEFKRVTKPGGKIALLYWSGQSLLPGHPVLEARLNEAFAEWAPYLAGVTPERHYLRAGSWLREAGMKRPRVKTFLSEVGAPLKPVMRQAVAACFAMFWDELEGRVSPADWQAYRRLCDPESPGFIADEPDYHAVVTYTLFWGVK